MKVVALVSLVLSLVLGSACLHPPPAAIGAGGRELPFDGPPTVVAIAGVQTGATAKVQASVLIRRDVMPTDDLALVVRVGANEVGRYPLVGKLDQGKPTRIKQDLDLPLGDYDVDLVYAGTSYAGLPFRVASVPAWGGREQLEVRTSHGTRISLREKRLWVARWWANDGPSQPWIIEWVRDGQVVTLTSGHEEHWTTPKLRDLVDGALHAYVDAAHWHNSVWALGEEYPVPDVVAAQPGSWAARIVHGGAPPIAVMFSVLPNNRIADADPRLVAAPSWDVSWSKPLATRALGATETTALDAKLPQITGSEPLDDEPQATIVPPVRLTQTAVRALFRSRQLAETWSAFLAANKVAVTATPAAAPLKGPRAAHKPERTIDKEALKAMRAKIDELIKQHGGAWKPDELPRS